MHFQVESLGRKSETMPAQFDELATGRHVADSRVRILRNPLHLHSALRWTNLAESAGLPRASTKQSRRAPAFRHVDIERIVIYGQR
jgi:hypothetical protein